MTAETGQNEVRPTRWVWVALSLLVLGVFSIRYAAFSTIEPRIDQAYFASSVRELASADHLLPKATLGRSFRQALESDTRSALYAIGRPIYVSPPFAFELIPFLVGSAALFLIGYSYVHVVALSVLMSAITLVPVTVLFRRCARTTSITGIAAACFSASATYSSLFSPWGVHNFGVFTLVLAIAFATPMMADSPAWAHSSIRRLAVLGAVTLLAAYSHFTNPLLAPLTFLLGVVGLPEIPVRRRIHLAALYGFIVCVGLAPVGLMSAALHQTGNSFLVFANAGTSPASYLAGMPQRAVLWFVSGAHLVSVPGVVTGIVGLAWMASVTRFRLPFCLLVAHFTCYCLTPGFIWNGSNTYLRTYNYVIPFLAIGMGWMLLQVIAPSGFLQGHGVLRMLAALCLVWHLVVQIPVNGYEAWARRHVPDFAIDYLDGSGELRPIIRSIEQRVGADPLVFQDFSARYVYLSVSSNKTDNVLSSALSSAGRGELLLKKSIPAIGYIVAIQSGSFSEESLGSELIKTRGGEARVRFVERWPCSIPMYGPFALYQMYASLPPP